MKHCVYQPLAFELTMLSSTQGSKEMKFYASGLQEMWHSTPSPVSIKTYPNSSRVEEAHAAGNSLSSGWRAPFP